MAGISTSPQSPVYGNILGKKQLCVVETSAELLNRAREWVLQLGKEVLVIADHKSAADSFVHTLSLQEGSLIGFHRMSIMGFAGILASPDMARRGYVPLSRIGREAIASRVATKVLDSQGLNYFHLVAGFPGFPRALARTFEDIRLNSVSRSFLANQSEAGSDISGLLTEYESELEAQFLGDRLTVFQSALRFLNSEGNRYLKMPILLLNPRLNSAVVKEFVHCLLEKTPEVCFIAIKDESRNYQAMFNLLGEAGVVTVDLEKEGSDGWTARLRKRLFSATLGDSPHSVGDHFQFFSASGEGRECVEIARKVNGLVDCGFQFDEMAVFLRDPERYQPILEEAFNRAGIPACFTLGTARPDPSGRAFAALLDCVLEGLSATRFSEYLSFSQFPFRNPQGIQKPCVPWIPPADDHQMVFSTKMSSESIGENQEHYRLDTVGFVDEPEDFGSQISPRKWEQLIIDASVIGGKSRWERRLKGLRADLKLRASRIEDEAERSALLFRADQLEKLSDFALPLVGFLSRLPQQSSWGVWLEKLRELAVLSLKKPQAILELLAEFSPMAEVGPVGLAEIREALSDRLSWLRRDPPEEPGHVYVATLEESRARSFKIVFIPGLAEGIFPKRIREDPLWLDEQRREFSSLISTRKDRIQEERNLLSQAVAAAEHRIIASYPRIDITQGRALVPSLYAVELIRAAEGKVPDLEVIESMQAEVGGRLGWPAPKYPSEAIDTAEYDLSWLDILLHDSTSDKRGKGRFLMVQNPWLAQAVRVRYKRWQSAWGEEDGIILKDSDDTLEDLRNYHPSSFSFSPTTLQHYAVCPYRFFLKGILRLQPRERIERFEKMDPLIRGSLFHETQFELFEALYRKSNRTLTELELDTALTELDEILDQVNGRYRERLAPAIEGIWESEVEELRVDLRVWLKDMMRSGREWQPTHWEYSFGLPGDTEYDSQSRSENILLYGKFRVKGSIDLIEHNRVKDSYRVIDHKTGRALTPQPLSVGKGEVLQPLIYALAVETVFEKEVEAGELFYCTQKGGFQRYRFSLSTEARSAIETVFDIVGESLEKGHFPAAPREGACQYCDYHSICGPYEELRVSRKKQGNLSQLRRLRELP